MAPTNTVRDHTASDPDKAAVLYYTLLIVLRRQSDESLLETLCQILLWLAGDTCCSLSSPIKTANRMISMCPLDRGCRVQHCSPQG